MSAGIRRGERRRQATRTALLGAGQKLFAARAIDAVSVDEIVAEADVAKGSFYNHFDDKEGLGRAIVELVQGDCEFHIYAANRDVADPAARVVRALCVAVHYARAHPERLQALISLAERRTVAGTPLNRGLVADLRDGLDRKRFAGVDIEAGVVIVIGMVHLTARHVCSGDAGRSPSDFAAMIGAAQLRALGVDAEDASRLAREAAAELLGADA